MLFENCAVDKITFECLCSLLISENIAYEVLTHKQVFTITDVLKELNIPECLLAKSLLIIIGSNDMCRVVLPGMARLDAKKLASSLGIARKNIRFANSDAIERAGFTVGAIPPFGGGIPTYFDKSLLDQRVVFCGSGDNSKTFSLNPRDIVELASASVVNVSTDQ